MRRRWWMVPCMLALLGGLGGCAMLRTMTAPPKPVHLVERNTKPGPVESALLAEAADARAFGDDDVALALFHDVLAENPMVAVAYVGMGEIYYDRAQYDRAEGSYARAARLEPENPVAHYGRGRSLQMLDRGLEAMKAYHRTLTLDPDHPRANLDLGTIYLQLDEPDSALTFARRAVDLAPDDARARANLGAVYEVLGRHEEAVEQYLAAAELAEPTPELLLNLVNVLSRAKRYQEALNVAEALARQAPSADVYERIGWAHFRLRDEATALESYRHALSIDENHWPSWNGVGVITLNRWITSDRRDAAAWTEARDAFRRSLRINNDQPKVVSLMARFGLQ